MKELGFAFVINTEGSVGLGTLNAFSKDGFTEHLQENPWKAINIILLVTHGPHLKLEIHVLN